MPDDQLSLAIGRRGQNVRLASQLTGWYIDILSEAEESERRQEEFKTRSTRFIEALNIDDVIAHLLVAEGFVSVDDIALTPVSDLRLYKVLMRISPLNFKTAQQSLLRRKLAE